MEKINEERREDSIDLDGFIQSYFTTYEDINYRDPLSMLPCRYYLLCASESPDDVIMWKNLAKDGTYCGYNLGLDVETIITRFSNQAAPEVEFMSGEVIYEHEKQVDMFYRILVRSYKDYDERGSNIDAGNSEELGLSWDSFCEDVLYCASKKKVFMKALAFASEKEFRFVLNMPENFSKGFGLTKKHRVGSNGIIIPYLEWDFSAFAETLLQQITLPPSVEPELAERSIKGLLEKASLPNVKIVYSSAKMRH